MHSRSQLLPKRISKILRERASIEIRAFISSQIPMLFKLKEDGDEAFKTSSDHLIYAKARAGVLFADRDGGGGQSAQTFFTKDNADFVTFCKRYDLLGLLREYLDCHFASNNYIEDVEVKARPNHFTNSWADMLLLISQSMNHLSHSNEDVLKLSYLNFEALGRNVAGISHQVIAEQLFQEGNDALALGLLSFSNGRALSAGLRQSSMCHLWIALESESVDTSSGRATAVRDCILELLSDDDTQAGRIEKWLKGKGKDLDHEVVSIFLDFPKSASVNKALALLGEATRDLTGPDQSNRKGAMAWKLVSSFCRVHELKTSIALLQELARRDDFIAFLYEAKREGIDREHAVTIGNASFSSPVLGAHVNKSLASSCSSSTSIFERKDQAKASWKTPVSKTFEILAGSRHDVKSLAKQLLLLALTEKTSMYAITAASLPNVRADLALLVWLHIQTQEEGNPTENDPTPQLSTQLFSIVNNGVDGVTHQLGEEEMMLHMIGTFYSGHTLPTLLLGLDLFWPESALAIIVRFVQACHFAKFDQARNYARQTMAMKGEEYDVSYDTVTLERTVDEALRVNKFEAARKLLRVCRICTGSEAWHNITKSQINFSLRQFRSSHLWRFKAERLKYWESVQSFLAHHRLPDATAASIMHTICMTYSSEISAMEKLQLLSGADRFASHFSGQGDLLQQIPFQVHRNRLVCVALSVMVRKQMKESLSDMLLSRDFFKRMKSGAGEVLIMDIVAVLLDDGLHELAEDLSKIFESESNDLRYVRVTKKVSGLLKHNVESDAMRASKLFIESGVGQSIGWNGSSVGAHNFGGILDQMCLMTTRATTAMNRLRVDWEYHTVTGTNLMNLMESSSEHRISTVRTVLDSGNIALAAEIISYFSVEKSDVVRVVVDFFLSSSSSSSSSAKTLHSWTKEKLCSALTLSEGICHAILSREEDFRRLCFPRESRFSRNFIEALTHVVVYVERSLDLAGRLERLLPRHAT
eukprot:g2942.t1